MLTFNWSSNSSKKWHRSCGFSLIQSGVFRLLLTARGERILGDRRRWPGRHAHHYDCNVTYGKSSLTCSCLPAQHFALSAEFSTPRKVIEENTADVALHIKNLFAFYPASENFWTAIENWVTESYRLIYIFQLSIVISVTNKCPWCLGLLSFKMDSNVKCRILEAGSERTQATGCLSRPRQSPLFV